MKMKYLDASTLSKPVADGKYVENLYLPAQQAKLELLLTCLNFDPRVDAIVMVGGYLLVVQFILSVRSDARIHKLR